MPIVRDYLDVYRKRPTAIETFAVDFRDRIPRGQLPVSQAITVYDSTGTDVTGTLLLISNMRGSRVLGTFKLGADLQDYFAVFALVCSVDRLEETIKIEVRS